MDILHEFPWLGYVVVAIAGYLIGSVSNPRIMLWILSRRNNQESADDAVENKEEPITYTATHVGREHGKQFGCLTAILDMIKVAAPTIIVLLLFPGQVHYLVIALAAIVGNSYPLYHRFKGGVGYSAILGAVFVINWFGVFIANGAAMLLGWMLGSIVIMRAAGNILLIFWFWIYFNDIYHVGFAVLANVVFWLSAMGHIRQLPDIRKSEDVEVNHMYWARRLLMGDRFGRFMEHYSLPALLKKIFRPSS